MNRKQADIAAAVLVGSIVLVGVITAVEIALTDGGPMGEAESAPTMRFLGPVFMSLVIASIVGGIYVYVRGQVFEPETDVTAGGAGRVHDQEREETADAEPSIEPGEVADSGPSGSSGDRHLLDVLPEDERKILCPVVESPGLTQVAVRDRSGFSKSKVSQTITDLEARGLLYRERQGRTYRVYPADDIDERL